MAPNASQPYAARGTGGGDGRDCAPVTVGRYVLFPPIAQGGMASVHIGRVSGAAGFARTVAIKRLHPQFARDPEFVSMFVDEARLAARVQHPNVVSVLDVVALEGELFLVMDFIRGDSLSRLLQVHREQASLAPIDISVAVVASALRGLHAAHEARSELGEPLHIVHRDVSPQNILVGVDGTARLADFGIARAAHRSQSTREGQLKGKLDYMAPEQYENQPATRQTDIYAASVVLWEALTSRRLLEPAGTPGARVLRVLHGNFPPPSTHNPSVCRELDRVVARGLSRCPQDRFETAHDMAEALERAVSPASTSRVAQWVNSLASAWLRERDRLITRVETFSAYARAHARSPGEAQEQPSHSEIRIVSQPSLPPEASAQDVDLDSLLEEPGTPVHAGPAGPRAIRLPSWKALGGAAAAVLLLACAIAGAVTCSLHDARHPDRARLAVQEAASGLLANLRAVHTAAPDQGPATAATAGSAGPHPEPARPAPAARQRASSPSKPEARGLAVRSDFRKLSRR